METRTEDRGQSSFNLIFLSIFECFVPLDRIADGFEKIGDVTPQAIARLVGVDVTLSMKYYNSEDSNFHRCGRF